MQVRFIGELISGLKFAHEAFCTKIAVNFSCALCSIQISLRLPFSFSVSNVNALNEKQKTKWIKNLELFCKFPLSLLSLRCRNWYTAWIESKGSYTMHMLNACNFKTNFPNAFSAHSSAFVLAVFLWAQVKFFFVYFPTVHKSTVCWKSRKRNVKTACSELNEKKFARMNFVEICFCLKMWITFEGIPNEKVQKISIFPSAFSFGLCLVSSAEIQGSSNR